MKYVKLVDKQSGKIHDFFPSLAIALERIDGLKNSQPNSQRRNLRDWLKCHDWELINELGQKVRAKSPYSPRID